MQPKAEIGSVSRRHAEIRLRNPETILQRRPDAVAHEGRLRFPVASEESVPALVRELVGLGAEIVEVSVKGAELEELYLELVEGRT